jgi:hypothetical protein
MTHHCRVTGAGRFDQSELCGYARLKCFCGPTAEAVADPIPEAETGIPRMSTFREQLICFVGPQASPIIPRESWRHGNVMQSAMPIEIG